MYTTKAEQSTRTFTRFSRKLRKYFESSPPLLDGGADGDRIVIVAGDEATPGCTPLRHQLPRLRPDLIQRLARVSYLRIDDRLETYPAREPARKLVSGIARKKAPRIERGASVSIRLSVLFLPTRNAGWQTERHDSAGSIRDRELHEE